jgi:hypothetical protein
MWFRPVAPPVEQGFESRELVAHGAHAALVRTPQGTFLLQDSGGVLGIIEPPTGATWFGFDASDRVLTADTQGRLWRADGNAAALDAHGYVQIASVEQALNWSFAGRFVVAAIGERIRLSADGGESFGTPSPALGTAIGRVVVRPDGIVVARDKSRSGSLWIFGSEGKWRRSAFQTPCIGSFGPWIYAGDTVPQEVLASDGHTWLSADDWHPQGLSPCGTEFPLHLRARDTAMPSDWAHLLEWSYEPLGTRKGLPKPSMLGAQPRAPQASVGRTGTAAQCENDPHAPHQGPEDCRWAQAEPSWRLALPRDVPSPFAGSSELYPGLEPQSGPWMFLLSDAECDASQVLRSQHMPPGVCSPHARWSQLPHLGILDAKRGSMRVVPLPSACPAPLRVLSGAGIGFLLCRDGVAVQVESVDETGQWYAEARLPLTATVLNSLQFASDGTALLSGCARDTCLAFVRSPRELGHARWQEASEPEAIGYRVVSDGRAIAILARSQASVRIAACTSREPTGLVRGIELRSSVLIDDLYERKGRFVARGQRDGSPIELPLFELD